MHAADKVMGRTLPQANNDAWIQMIGFQGNYVQEKMQIL
jgi:hypothetical protein